MLVTTSRLRITALYLLAFVPILLIFSIAIYSEVSRTLCKYFDNALLRVADYAIESFIEQAQLNSPDYAGTPPGKPFEAAQAVVARLRSQAMRQGLRMGNVRIAILRDGVFLAATTPEFQKSLAQNSITHATGDGIEYGFNGKPSDRLVSTSFIKDNSQYKIIVAEPWIRVDERLRHLQSFFFFAIPATLFITAIICYFIATHTLRAVTSIAGQAARISVDNLGDRIHVMNDNDELGRLAQTFNELLGRLEGSFVTMRDFMADASHELRTPLAIIQGEADVSLASADRSADRQALEIIRGQSRRMGGIVNDLLALARTDAGQQRWKFEELYLNDLVTECCIATKVLMDRKHLTLRTQCEEDVGFNGCEELLTRMTVNLLDNAVRHTPTGGMIQAKVARQGDEVLLVVADNGVGIAESAREYLFNRFFPGANAQRAAEGCSGLGLAIVKMAVETHGGSIEVESQAGRGATFTVRLPLRAADNQALQPRTATLIQH